LYRIRKARAKEAVLPEITYFSAPFTKDYEKRSPVPKSKHDEYLKLFNAVWNNDRTTVEKLTRPSPGVKSTKLLHIGVTDGTGHSLLSIACLRRHVEMAQLILRIADEQFEEYVDTKEKTNKTGKQINNYRLHQCK
jgi:ankyrin repeat protein